MPPVILVRTSAFGFARMFLHASMWRSAALLLNFRLHVGHTIMVAAIDAPTPYLLDDAGGMVARRAESDSSPVE